MQSKKRHFYCNYLIIHEQKKKGILSTVVGGFQIVSTLCIYMKYWKRVLKCLSASFKCDFYENVPRKCERYEIGLKANIREKFRECLKVTIFVSNSLSKFYIASKRHHFPWSTLFSASTSEFLIRIIISSKKRNLHSSEMVTFWLLISETLIYVIFFAHYDIQLPISRDTDENSKFDLRHDLTPT